MIFECQYLDHAKDGRIELQSGSGGSGASGCTKREDIEILCSSHRHPRPLGSTVQKRTVPPPSAEGAMMG